MSLPHLFISLAANGRFSVKRKNNLINASLSKAVKKTKPIYHTNVWQLQNFSLFLSCSEPLRLQRLFQKQQTKFLQSKTKNCYQKMAQ